MEFNEDLEQFIFEFNGLIFAWDEEPGENYLEQVKTLSEKYNAHLNFIVEFKRLKFAKCIILPELNFISYHLFPFASL